LLLDSQHAKNQPPHKVAISKLITKQQVKLKSPIKDVNECLNSVRICFNSLYSLFSPGSRVVNHFSSRISFYSPSSSFDEDLYQHLQSFNHAFRTSQVLPNSAVVIANGGVKKSHVTTAVAHIWSDNVVIKELQVNSINITALKAKLMAIHTRLILAMQIDNIHNIIIITNSIVVGRKILESKVGPLQNMVILLPSAIKSFFSKDGKNKIHFWYCSSKTKWPRYKLVNKQVKANTCIPNKKQIVIKPAYAKGSSRLPVIEFTNLLYACFTCMTTRHTPIREYRQRFFSYLLTSCPCSEAKVQTCEYIIMECNRHNPST